MLINSSTNLFQTTAVLPVLPRKLNFYGLRMNDFIRDGFEFVCNINNSKSNEDKWYYENIVQSIMYCNHRSWVYFIVVDGYIFKIGETSQPLGVRKSGFQIQPNTGSKSRLGRYIDGDGTDEAIRESSVPYITDGYRIEIWAKKCEISKAKTLIFGEETEIQQSTQKDQEMAYINKFEDSVGIRPIWNKYRK